VTDGRHWRWLDDHVIVEPRDLRRRRVVPPLALAVALLTHSACSEHSAERPVAAKITSSELRAYRDAKTGAFGPRPAGVSAMQPRAALNGTTAARAPLQETAAPGGGRMVHLQGSFRSHVTAKLAPTVTTVSCGLAAR
jgi:hypothetical protein